MATTTIRNERAVSVQIELAEVVTDRGDGVKRHVGEYRASVNGEEIARREFDGSWRRKAEARAALFAMLDSIEELH